MAEQQDAERPNPNQATIFKVVHAQQLEQHTKDGWELERVLETPGVHVTGSTQPCGTYVDNVISGVTFYMTDFLLRWTRDVTNIERAEQAEKAQQQSEREKAVLFKDVEHVKKQMELRGERVDELNAENHKFRTQADQARAAIRHLQVHFGLNKMDELLGEDHCNNEIGLMPR